MRWLPAGCHQRMLPAETKDGRPREAGKPPGQNSPTRGSCPNTGSQSAPRQGEIKGAAQKGKVIFTLSARPQTIEGGPPQTQTLGQASETPRRRDAETQRRGLPLPVWRGGGARGAFWFVYKEAPPALGGYEPALESQCPGGCRQRVRWFSPPRRRSHPLRRSQRQVKGHGSAASPAFAPGASPQS